MERVEKGKKGKRGGKRGGKEMERKGKREGKGKKIFTNIKKEKKRGKREVDEGGERVGKGKRGRKRAPRAPPAWPRRSPRHRCPSRTTWHWSSPETKPQGSRIHLLG